MNGGGAKEIEAPTLARRSRLNKGTGQVGTTRKEGMTGTPLKIHRELGSGEVGPPYLDNREMRKGRSPKLHQDQVGGPSVQKERYGSF